MTRDAKTYLDVYSDKYDLAVCPPPSLFKASEGTGYWPPSWGFQNNVANDYGKVVVERHADCSGGIFALVRVRLYLLFWTGLLLKVRILVR